MIDDSVFLGRQVIISVQLGDEGCDDVGGCEGEVRSPYRSGCGPVRRKPSELATPPDSMTAPCRNRSAGGSPECRRALRRLKANALRGGRERLSVRAVKAAWLAFIGAKRRALTGEAEGAGAGSSQEGQTAKRTVDEKVF